MKILAAGDIHGDINLAKSLAERAVKEEVDYVIICGDITYGDMSTTHLIKPFVERNLKVFIIPGNHESIATTGFLSELYGIKNLHGYAISSNNVGVFGAGGATNVGPAPIVTEEELFGLLDKGHDKIKDLQKKIMVTHMHPSESLMGQLSEFVPPSTAVKKAIDTFKPNILLCSHVHEAEGIEEMIGNTKVINVGKKGKIIEL
tara:strand:- start:9081 stop:9689 length:609 start_codon:yes stop_codon:yes gene_type:complete